MHLSSFSLFVVLVLNLLTIIFFTVSTQRISLLCEIKYINADILKQDNELFVQTLDICSTYFGNNNISQLSNANILSSTMEYILATKRFHVLLV